MTIHCLPPGAGSGILLMLDGHRVRLTGTATDEIDAVRGWMCPPAGVEHCDPLRDWTLILDETSERFPTAPKRWSVRLSATGWPRVFILDGASDRLDAIGQYRQDDPPVRVTVDRRARQTTVGIPSGLGRSVRWADWLVRIFFGTRMLAAGWQLLHASCVGLGAGAVVIGGAAGAGKSSLAHLACAQLGAAFVADDLVLVRKRDGVTTAVGWPTRISLPVELMALSGLARSEVRLADDGRRRERWVLGPREHASATGFQRRGAAPVAVAVVLERDSPSPGVNTLAAEADQKAYMTDVLGLMGEPAPALHEGRETSESALSALFEGVSVITVRADRPATELAPTVWELIHQTLTTRAAA